MPALELSRFLIIGPSKTVSVAPDKSPIANPPISGIACLAQGQGLRGVVLRGGRRRVELTAKAPPGQA